MLYTKSIIKPKSLEDGIRISVMSRHTLNDGVTPHPQISENSYDEHLEVFAPPAKLIGDYYKRELPWEYYEVRYIDHLNTTKVFPQVMDLARRALVKDITLLCIEETVEKCHRRLLAEECQRYEPNLKVEHR